MQRPKTIALLRSLTTMRHGQAKKDVAQFVVVEHYLGKTACDTFVYCRRSRQKNTFSGRCIPGDVVTEGGPTVPMDNHQCFFSNGQQGSSSGGRQPPS